MRIQLAALAVSGLLTCTSAVAGGVRHRPHRHPVMVMKATAFTRAVQPTTSGTDAREGIVAADPAVLPLGSRIRISGTDAYDGEYLVTDTGALVKGRHIDVYLNSHREAKQFGCKMVRVQVLEVGEGRADAREKDQDDRNSEARVRYPNRGRQ